MNVGGSKLPFSEAPSFGVLKFKIEGATLACSPRYDRSHVTCVHRFHVRDHAYKYVSLIARAR